MDAYAVLQAYGHTQADVEHVFLALVEQSDSNLPVLFTKLDAPLEDVRARLNAHLQHLSKTSLAGGETQRDTTGQVYITPRLQRLFSNANEEANKLSDAHISTEHLFLAIVREGRGPASEILSTYRVTYERTLHALEAMCGQPIAAVQSEQADVNQTILEALHGLQAQIAQMQQQLDRLQAEVARISDSGKPV